MLNRVARTRRECDFLVDAIALVDGPKGWCKVGRRIADLSNWLHVMDDTGLRYRLCSRSETRYRSLIKDQIWVNIRRKMIWTVSNYLMTQGRNLRLHPSDPFDIPYSQNDTRKRPVIWIGCNLDSKWSACMVDHERDRMFLITSDIPWSPLIVHLVVVQLLAVQLWSYLVIYGCDRVLHWSFMVAAPIVYPVALYSEARINHRDHEWPRPSQ